MGQPGVSLVEPVETTWGSLAFRWSSSSRPQWGSLAFRWSSLSRPHGAAWRFAGRARRDHMGQPGVSLVELVETTWGSLAFRWSSLSRPQWGSLAFRWSSLSRPHGAAWRFAGRACRDHMGQPGVSLVEPVETTWGSLAFRWSSLSRPHGAAWRFAGRACRDHMGQPGVSLVEPVETTWGSLAFRWSSLSRPHGAAWRFAGRARRDRMGPPGVAYGWCGAVRAYHGGCAWLPASGRVSVGGTVAVASWRPAARRLYASPARHARAAPHRPPRHGMPDHPVGCRVIGGGSVGRDGDGAGGGD